MIRRLLDWLFPRVDIRGPDGTLYLSRWVLWGGDDDKRRVYLHRFERGDWDRHLHDHPWPFLSVLLWGSYTEVTHAPDDLPWFYQGEDRVRERQQRIRWFNYRPDPRTAHRVELTHGKPVWTILFIGKKQRDWGFHTERGWVNHEEYLDLIFGEGNWPKTEDVLG